jgi:hypothetical protein
MLNAAPDTPAGPVTVGHLLFLQGVLTKELIQMVIVRELVVLLGTVAVKVRVIVLAQSQEELLVS